MQDFTLSYGQVFIPLHTCPHFSIQLSVLEHLSCFQILDTMMTSVAMNIEEHFPPKHSFWDIGTEA